MDVDDDYDIYVPGGGSGGAAGLGGRVPPAARVPRAGRSGDDRGLFLRRTRQRVRHLVPSLRVWLLAAGGVTLVHLAGPPVFAALLPKAHARLVRSVSPHVLQGLHDAGVFVTALAWVVVGVQLVGIAVRAWCYRVDFYDRGFEWRQGVVNRRRKFYWYYQMPEEAEYVRTLGTYLTWTASLRIIYEGSRDKKEFTRRRQLGRDQGDAESEEQERDRDHVSGTYEIMLEGVGTPREVGRIYRDIEQRRTQQRRDMKGYLA